MTMILNNTIMSKHKIEFISDDVASINGKTAYKGHDEQWHCGSRLTQEEKEAFQEEVNKL